ncbi:MAG: hypothetical protein ACPH5G_05220 [Pseudooceanicola atlanticus]
MAAILATEVAAKVVVATAAVVVVVERPAAAALARHGLRFDLPEPAKVSEVIRPAPGSDPEKPPILK